MNKAVVDLSELRAVSLEQWDKLANKKIYFGPQSVGYNIIDGVKEIMVEMPSLILQKPRIGRIQKQILILMARLDSETAEFDREFKSKVLDKRTEYSKLCEVNYLEKTGHSLMFEESRKQLIKLA